MEEVVAYLEAIEGINHAERELEGPTITAQLRRAYQAAEAAWAAIAPHHRSNMSPPPVLPEGG